MVSATPSEDAPDKLICSKSKPWLLLFWKKRINNNPIDLALQVHATDQDQEYKSAPPYRCVWSVVLSWQSMLQMDNFQKGVLIGCSELLVEPRQVHSTEIPLTRRIARSATNDRCRTEFKNLWIDQYKSIKSFVMYILQLLHIQSPEQLGVTNVHFAEGIIHLMILQVTTSYPALVEGGASRF